MSGVRGLPVPGWYPAPDGRPASRYWDGTQWTSWLTDGRTRWSDAPVRRPLTSADVSSLRFIEDVFLPEAIARGAVDPHQRARLGWVVTAMLSEAAASASSSAAVAQEEEQEKREEPVVFASPAPATTPRNRPEVGPPSSLSQPNAQNLGGSHPVAIYQGGAAPSQARTPGSRGPGRVARWWAETWVRIGSDVAVHGLAYLGVLLLFVGVFGLVAFAFGTVTPSVRPIAELASAVVAFAAARMLLQHGATVVARAMEGVAGLILPLMIITSTVDDFPFPPDLRGGAMPVVLAAVCLSLAAGYVVWVGRHRSSGLRFVVAPTMWLGVAMGAIGIGRPIPTGQDVAVPSSGQVAAIAVAVLLTAVIARFVPTSAETNTETEPDRRRLGAALVGPAQSAAIVGSVVVAVLALVTWIAEGWPTVAIAVTAVSIAATWQLLPRVPGAVADVGAVLWWVLVAIRLLSEAGLSGFGVAGSVAALGFVVLLEVTGRRARSVTAVGLAAGGLILILLAEVRGAPDVLWSVGLCAVLAVWASARRRAPFRIAGARPVLDVLAAAFPVLGVVSVVSAESLDVALLFAVGVVLLATVPARVTWFGRGPSDRFWLSWWRLAGGVTIIAVLLRGGGTLQWFDPVLYGLLNIGSAGWLSWTPVIAAAALALVALAGPLDHASRTWTVIGLSWWAWILGTALADADPMLRAAIPAAVGLVLVVVAHTAQRRTPDATATVTPAPDLTGLEATRPVSVFSALGLAGHLLGVVTAAVAFGNNGWAAELAFVLATLGWMVTAVAADRGSSPVAHVLDRLDVIGRLAPWTLTFLGLPLAAIGVLHLANVVDFGQAWGTTPLTVAALTYAGALRWIQAKADTVTVTVTVTVTLPSRTRATGPLIWIAFASAVAATPAAAGLWPFVVAGAGLVGAVWLIPAGRRAPVMVWTAWFAVVPVLAVTASALAAGLPSGGRNLAVLWTIVGGSGLLALSALVADGARPNTPRVLPRRRALRPPMITGVVQLFVGLGLALALASPTQPENAVVLEVAGLLLALAAVSGVGVTAGIALGVGWLGWHLLAAPGTPWADVAAAGALVAAGVGLSLIPKRRSGWSRWDVPIVLAGTPAALFALATAQGASFAPVYIVTGLLVVGAAVRLQGRRLLSELLGATGAGIILVGAVDASTGWLALALLALSGAHTAIAAVRPHGTARVIRQAVGAVAAASAWGATLNWLDWSVQPASEVTALGGAATVVLLLLATIIGHRGRSWTAIWGATATLLSLGALAVVAGGGGAAWTWWHVAALGLLAFAAGLVVRLWPRVPGRTVAVVVGLFALLVAFSVLGWPAPVRIGVLVALSAACAVGTVLLSRRSGPSNWLAPVTGAGVATVILALGIAVTSWSGLLAATLAGATVQAAASGFAWRKIGLRLAAPVLAWVTWAALLPEITSGVSVAWYTLPVGLALLTIVTMWRAERTSLGLAPSDSPGVVLELTGIAFLVVTSWVQAFTVSVLHALLATLIGIAVLVWGLATRVRRRFAAGAVVILVSLVLAVMAPLVALVPQWGGSVVWIAVAVLGLVAVLVATLLERGRAVADRAGERGWE